jgi:hypothetical protein
LGRLIHTVYFNKVHYPNESFVLQEIRFEVTQVL